MALVSRWVKKSRLTLKDRDLGINALPRTICAHYIMLWKKTVVVFLLPWKITLLPNIRVFF
jgi:hypothetical protein